MLPKKLSRIEPEVSQPASIAGATLQETPSASEDSPSFIRRSLHYWFDVRARVRSLADERPLQFVAGVAVLAFSIGIVLKVTGRGHHE